MPYIRHRHGVTVDTGGGGVTTGGTRDKNLWPFATDSPWNLPRATNAQFETTGSRVSQWLSNTFTDAWHSGTQNYFPMTLDSALQQPISVASATDPLTTITDQSHGVVYTIRVPSNATIASGSDAHMGIIGTDGFFYESWGTQRVDATHITSGRLVRIDLRGSGIGPQNGVRAYGGSMIGGQIRAWEVAQRKIQHAISMVLPWSLLYADRANSGWGYFYNGERINNGSIAPGWPVGLNLTGFDKELGYVWPATEQDYASISPDHYMGLFGMGAYWSIPNTTDITTLGLNADALVVARAIQDYGAYVVDTDGADAGIVIGNVETAASTASVRSSLTAGLGGQVDKIRKAMLPVIGNAYDNPNGGSLTAARRAALAPALA
jgi:hypothetical protein